MKSGIGGTKQLRSLGIGVVQHLPGVGANLREHVLLGGCVWEYGRPDQFRGSGGEATFFVKSNTALATPDLQAFVIDGPFLSAELSGHMPAGPAWSIAGECLNAVLIDRSGRSSADPLQPPADPPQPAMARTA
jgi:choline dehydrogenase